MAQLPRGRQRRLIVIAAVVVLAVVLLTNIALDRPKAKVEDAGPPPVPVITATAREENVPIYLAGIGSVTAFYSVAVKARVDGQLDKVMFREGQDVKAGEVLAQIDARPYRAALEQAVATKARDQAQLANALIDLQRYQTLWGQNSIPQQQLATQEATVAQLKATIQADEAEIDTAKVQLDYTTIRAPIRGRTGTRLVDPGNIVHAADASGIVVINQIDPITALFTLPENAFQTVHRAIEADRGHPLQVLAYAREDGTLLDTGKLLLVNNQIDTATGTFQLKAVFLNAKHNLWPGQFVQARLVLGVRQRATTVPESVVQRGPNGLFAYVVHEDTTVAMQPIRVAQTQEGKAVIDDGLSPGARVVVEGQYKLKPGARITEVSRPAPASPASGRTPAAASLDRKASP